MRVVNNPITEFKLHLSCYFRISFPIGPLRPRYPTWILNESLALLFALANNYFPRLGVRPNDFDICVWLIIFFVLTAFLGDSVMDIRTESMKDALWLLQ
jgi:hypothetical protein